jgi:predicted dehydrogenase
MTGSVTADPLRIGVLGAARIADLAIVQPARLTGHRLVAVAARDHRRAEDFAQRHGVELGRRSSYTYQLEAFAAHLRQGTPLPTDADDAVVNMQLIDDCYRAAGLSPRPAHQPLIKETQP